MEAILDFSNPGVIDVALLDRIVAALNEPTAPKEVRAQADRVLTAFKDHKDAYLCADKILESPGVSLNTRFFALQVLESVIRYRWRALPEAQRGGIKSYLGSRIVAVRWRPDRKSVV